MGCVYTRNTCLQSPGPGVLLWGEKRCVVYASVSPPLRVVRHQIAGTVSVRELCPCDCPILVAFRVQYFGLSQTTLQ